MVGSTPGMGRKKRDTLVTCQDSRELFRPQLRFFSAKSTLRKTLFALTAPHKKNAGGTSSTKHNRQQTRASTTRAYFCFPSTAFLIKSSRHGRETKRWNGDMALYIDEGLFFPLFFAFLPPLPVERTTCCPSFFRISTTVREEVEQKLFCRPDLHTS